MLSPYFHIQMSKTIWLVQLVTIILIWNELFAFKDPEKPLDQNPFTGKVALDKESLITQ